MIIVNPAPKSFVSTAKKDICSDNSGPDVTTAQIVASARQVHKTFQERGYYDAIKASSLYAKGNADHA